MIRLLVNANGELRAADGDRPTDPAIVRRYLANAFGDHLAEVRQAMHTLAARYNPVELNRVGFKLYERFRPEIPPGNSGWDAKAALDARKLLAAA